MRKPVLVDQLGEIYGRDAIYLDKIKFKGTNAVKLQGEFNSSLCSEITNIEDKFIPYKLIFKGLMKFEIVELDFYDSSDYVSSFEEIVSSKELLRFKSSSENFKIEKTHKHYVFYTYDDVIEVIASDFELKLELD